MPHFVDIIAPHYQKLLADCDKRKIAINLDIQAPTVNLRQVRRIDEFLTTEIKRALKNCTAGDKITIAETADAHSVRVSVKNSGRTTLSTEEKYALRAIGYEVRARFGYDTIISLVIDR